ncbi:hypothetical protein LBMAG53_25040 [Planctomycetota bacterium]|nr:hypothetical protein LBMAG53_25040 [Planctomycetota bacterium]
MRSLSLLLSWITAAVLAQAASVEAVAPRSGPWLILSPDGSGEVGIVLRAPIPDLTLVVGQQHQSPTIDGLVARWRLPTVPEALEVHWPGGTLAVPHLDANQTDLRLAVTAGRRWPDTAELERLGQALGGPVQAVLCLDPTQAINRRLGQSGWEPTIPILAAPSGPTRYRLGALALSGIAAAAALDLAWTVVVDPVASFDPGILAGSADSDLQRASASVAGARAQQAVLLFTRGSGCSVLTDPLTVTKGRVESQAEGTRLVVVGGAGDPPQRLQPEVARWAESPVTIGLSANAQELTLLALAGADPLWKQTWSHSAPAPTAAGTSPEHAQPATRPSLPSAESPTDHDSKEKPRAPSAIPDGGWKAAAPAELIRLAELPWSDLRALHLVVTPPLELVERAATDPAAARLLGRLTADQSWFNEGRWPELPPWVMRECILRDLADPLTCNPGKWPDLAAEIDDLLLLKVLVRNARDKPGILPILERTIAAMAAGRRPVPRDPYDQLHLFGAVFDSPHLSPTPLRPLALALRGQVAELAQGPLERFITHWGETRP